MTPLRLEIWADIVCPWCWLGEAALLRAVDGLGVGDEVRIEMRAFRLDPDPDPERLPTLERLQRKYRMSAEQADAAAARIAQLGAELGLDIHPERTVTSPTSDGHRLVRAAQPQGADVELMLALHRAYFTDGLDVGDHEVLRTVATSTGMAPPSSRRSSARTVTPRTSRPTSSRRACSGCRACRSWPSTAGWRSRGPRPPRRTRRACVARSPKPRPAGDARRDARRVTQHHDRVDAEADHEPGGGPRLQPRDDEQQRCDDDDEPSDGQPLRAGHVHGLPDLRSP